jgi:hypothetical protein
MRLTEHSGVVATNARPNTRRFAWVVTVVVLSSLSALDQRVAGGVLAITLVLGTLLWPDVMLEAMTFGMLAIRPALDAFGGRRLGLGPFASNPAVILGLGVLCVGLVIGIQRLRSGRVIWPQRSLWIGHLFLGIACVTEFLSAVRLYGGVGFGEATREIVRVASLVVGFLLVVWWVEPDESRARRGLIYVLSGAILPVAAALWQLATSRGYFENEGINRLQGTFSHPNTLAFYLVPLVLVALGTAISRKGLVRFTGIAVTVGLCSVMILTYSRTALLTVLAAFFLLPLLYASMKQERRFGLALLLIVIVAAGGWWLGGDTIRERFADLSVSGAAVDMARGGITENSFQWRIINWYGLITLGLEHPLAGHGAGMTTVLNPLVSAINGVPFNAHNDFVRFFFEGGLMGLVCYVVYGLILCAWAVRRARTTRSGLAPTALAIACAWISLLFVSLGNTEISLQTAVLYELYGLLAVVIVPGYYQVNSELPQDAPRAAAFLT